MSMLDEPRLRTVPRVRLLGRMLAACLMVVLAVAATIATGTLLEVKTFTDYLKQSPRLQLGGELARADAGGPQTLLLIGSDKRTKGAIDANGPPHTDTMMLVRLDPRHPETTMLSVPRDLEVMIHPDHGRATRQKINAAYSIGGARLAVQTVKRVLGIQINHVVDINFAAFKALVDYLGCVFVQVDRRYFNDNSPPAGGGAPYATIDIQPGYQRLCGPPALDYVRFRHLDTDLVRSARQQDFLRQIKNQVGAGGLVSQRYGIERIFGKYATTDIRSGDDVLKLLELLVQSAGHPVRQVKFTATLGPSYVTATPAQIRQSVQEFMHGGAAAGHIATGGGRGRKASPAVALTPATADELARARTLAGSVPFPLYYPSQRITSAFAPPDNVRSYRLHGNPAYVVVVAQGQLGQYYDLEGTSWTTPPILKSPNQTIELGGRRLQLYFEGQRLRLVAWHKGHAVYWVVNTLQDILTNRQMLAIAAAARTLPQTSTGR